MLDITQTFIIKGELTDCNTYMNAERSSRYAAADIKKAETERVAWDIKKHKLKPMARIDQIIIQWYSKDKKKDTDNIEFAKKFIMDGIVAAGIVPSDSRKYTGEVTTHRHYISNPPYIYVGLIGKI